MTETRRKAKIAMLEKGISFTELAERTGFKRGTIHNLLGGHNASQYGRQAISDLLQAEVFPGVSPRRTVSFPAGTEIECKTAEEAQADAAELGERVSIRGNVITFLRDTMFVRLDDDPSENLSAASRKKRTPHALKKQPPLSAGAPSLSSEK